VDLTSANWRSAAARSQRPDDLHVRLSLEQRTELRASGDCRRWISTRIVAPGEPPRSRMVSVRRRHSASRVTSMRHSCTLIQHASSAWRRCRLASVSASSARNLAACQAARANRRLPPDLRAHSPTSSRRISVLVRILVPGERLSHRCRVAALAQQRPPSLIRAMRCSVLGSLTLREDFDCLPVQRLGRAYCCCATYTLARLETRRR